VRERRKVREENWLEREKEREGRGTGIDLGAAKLVYQPTGWF
jgi:hypothetical protein